MAKWDQSLREHFSVVAVENANLVGFGDIDKTGYLDRLYVRADHQNKKLFLTAICNQLEQAVSGTLFTMFDYGKAFFEKRGYKVVKRTEG